MRNIYLLIILLSIGLQASELYALKLYNDLINVDSVLMHPQIEHTTIVRKSTERGNEFFYALTVKDMPLTIDTLMPILQNVRRYSKEFSHVKQSREISELNRTYFIEMRSRMARSWLVGNMKTISAGDTITKVVFLQNHDRQLNEKWKKARRGVINVGYRHFQIIWMLKKINEQNTRVALVAMVKPGIWVPDWLAQTTTKVVLPSFIHDLEKRFFQLSKTAPESSVEPAPEDSTAEQ